MPRMVEVKFTKEFVSGPLKGQTKDDIRKVPLKDKTRWIRSYQVLRDTQTVCPTNSSDFVIVAVDDS